MKKLAQLIDEEIKSIKQIPLDGSIEKAVKIIHQQAHLQKGKVVVSGVGKAGLVGLQLVTKFCSTGTPSCFLNPLEAQHGDLGLLMKNDVLFTISNSGATREVIELVQLSKKIHPEIIIVVLTKNKSSELAKLSDQVILTGDTEEICMLGLTPTTSTTVMNIIVDLLIVSMMELIGFSKEAYALRHHSGYLGNKAKS